MKRLLTILILIFSLQTPSQADDIRDFQIEGMSIGDSLLNYFTEEVIKKKLKKSYSYKNKFRLFSIGSSKYEIYDSVQFVVKPGDRKFEIHNIVGVLSYTNNISDCYKKKDIIAKELSDLFQDAKQNDQSTKHEADKSGKSTFIATYFTFKSGEVAQITCTDWSKELKWKDQLSVAIDSKEYGDFLQNEAF